MHDQDDNDDERMEGLLLTPGPSSVPGMLALEIGMDREHKKEVREREREKDVRHPKRFKSEQKLNPNPDRKGDRLSMKKASRHHTSSPAAAPTSSGVSGCGESGGAGDVKDERLVDLMPVSLTVPGKKQGSWALPRQGPPRQPQLPDSTSGTPQPPTYLFPRGVDVDLPSCPPELKIEGPDWFVLFNPSPKVKQVLDVNLVHTLIHDSVVYCVKFSRDGKWVPGVMELRRYIMRRQG